VTRRRRWLWAAGVVAALGVVAVLRGRFVTSSSNDDSARLRALEARLALLESRKGATTIIGQSFSPETHLSVPPPAAITESEKNDRPAKKSAPKLTEAQEAELQAEYFGDLDVRLSTELRDPVWAAATEEKLRNLVPDLRPRIDVENPRCGQTMCRVEARIPEVREEAAALEKFLVAAARVLPEAVIRDGDGPGRHIVYFAREGSAFPPMNAPEETAQH